MYLEKFNAFNRLVFFQATTGSASAETEVSSVNGQISGICDLVSSNWLALYIYDEKLTLQYEKRRIDIDAPNTVANYNHINGGVTHFQISRGKDTLLSLKYPSWWSQAQYVVAFGRDADEESDFCAYVKLITDSAAMKNHFRSVYSRHQ